MPEVHDRGGLPTDEPINQSDHQWADWEHMTNALVVALRTRDLMSVDELRRGIESIPPELYEVYSYYERWSASLETLIVEKGILTTDEIGAKVKELDERWG